MGALHAGHAKLLRRARQLAGTKGTVVATLFVNPTQFGPKEDLSRYPRTPREDAEMCQASGVDLLFAPFGPEMYAADSSTWVTEEVLSAGYCGASRPGHFRGVCTIVLKLLVLSGADIAVLGQKDYQQLAVIRRMCRDLDLPVRIVAQPTVRESDGLAMSSRNRYLSDEERLAALAFPRALRAVGEAIAFNKRIRAGEAERIFTNELSRSPLVRCDYFACADPETLQPSPPNELLRRPVVLLGAVFVGKTRLIDNLVIKA